MDAARPDGDMTLVRVAVPDRVGSLAAVAAWLSAAGLDIVRVEVVSADGTTAIDDLLLRGPHPERALAGMHQMARVLAVRQHATLPDPGLAMGEACAHLTGGSDLPAARLRLVESALQLVGAQHGVLLRAGGDGWLEPVASTVGPLEPCLVSDFGAARDALERGATATLSGDLEWAPPPLRGALAGGAAAVLAVGDPPSLVLVVVRADWFPFVSVEVERLRVLARVGWEVLRGQGERAGGSAASG